MIDLDLRSCELCPRLCRINREEKPGACGCSARLLAARAALHFGEEPCISGTEGSGTVFFAGCNLHCVFCQNHKISRERYGRELTAARLAEIFRELEAKGANNINLVTPTPWVTEIIKALELYRPKVPVLYNTSGYERVEVLRALEGLVDVWLPDYKYADGEIAARFSGARDYPEVAKAAIREMYRQSGNLKLNAEGKAVSGVMIRHLVLPLHLKNSFAVLEEIAEEYGTEQYVSLMFQYTPFRETHFPELNRSLTARERARAEDYFLRLGFQNGYIQEADSRGSRFLPDFNLEGV